MVLTSPIQSSAQSSPKTPGTALATIPTERYTNEVLSKMSLSQLTRVQEEYNNLTYRMENLRSVKPRNTRAEGDLLRLFEKFETREAVTFLLGVLSKELRNERPSLHVLESCLQALDMVLKPEPKEQLKAFAYLLPVAEKALGDYRGTSQVKEQSKQAVTYMSLILDRAEAEGGVSFDLTANIDKLLNTPARIGKSLDTMEAFLADQILGQPEVVDVIAGIEWKTQLYRGSRKLPNVVYLMGPYGTGKDTTAEAWADAKWGGEGLGTEHLFTLPVMSDNTSDWEVLGSATGYKGSNNVPRFIEFLVNHSGGRYLLQRTEDPSEPSFRIVQNPLWRGENLPGYVGPEKAVVFANEFHNWSKSNKDLVMKKALEHGFFKITNPNGGLEKIYVPVDLLIASNEGIELITATEANGQRIGKPQSYEDLARKQERVKDDKPALRRSILASNGAVNQTNQSDTARGISLEVLNRIPDRNLILMRILSPDMLKEVVRKKLAKIQARIAKESGFFQSVDFQWDPELVDLVQEYDYMAEDNARPVNAKVESLIEETLLRAIREKDIQLTQEKQDVAVHLGLEKNADGTHSLVIAYREAGGFTKTFRKLITSTIKDKPNPPVSDERILEIMSLPERMKKRVFNVDSLVDRIGERMLTIENQKTAKKADPRPCTVFVLLGPSSTGKTETFVVLAEEYMGDKAELITFDFSQIQTMEDFKTEILGSKTADGRIIPSRFMKAYDRTGGNLLVNFDELANVRDRDVLKSLYDFFRVPVMYTFSDGVARPMGGVIVGVTGNAGIEEYQNVPRHVPMVQQMKTWEEISKKIITSPGRKRTILERVFPGPLLSRWSTDEIFFFPPHTYKTLKQLAQLKLRLELKRLAVAESRRSWNVTVASREAYEELITTIVDEGFNLYDQGASIEAFVRKKFSDRLEALLIQNLVPSQSTVVLKLAGKTPKDNPEQPGALQFKVYVDGRMEPLDFSIARNYEPKPEIESEDELLLTSYHEAAHNLMRYVFFSDETKPGMMSILPGVTNIGGEWVVYDGIAETGAKVGKPHLDRNWFVQNIAVWMAGQAAERLVTNGSHTAGKADDIKRATGFAHDAILRYGLSATWGLNAIPPNMSMTDYLATLSQKQRDLLDRETKMFLSEGEALARKYLILNYDQGLIPLGALVAVKGNVSEEDTDNFYAHANIVKWDGKEGESEGLLSRTLKGVWSKLRPTPTTVQKWSLRPDLPRPRSMVNLQAMLEARKQELFNEVPTPEELPLGTNAAYLASLSLSECEQLLSKGDAP